MQRQSGRHGVGTSIIRWECCRSAFSSIIIFRVLMSPCSLDSKCFYTASESVIVPGRHTAGRCMPTVEHSSLSRSSRCDTSLIVCV